MTDRDAATGLVTYPLTVWAPHASRVDLVSGEDTVAMDGPDPRGWFRAPRAGLAPGTDYAYRLDGGPERPDPRSRWQPFGVHGRSRVADPLFAWTDVAWTGRPFDGTSVVYELHVGTFSPTGDFDGVLDRLDHLLALGVTHVELMPVAEFDGSRGWGYDGVDLWAVRHAYGGPDGLRRLVDACHRAGLAVLLDVVYNHLGPSGNYLREFGPYFTGRYSTPWGEAVNYDDAGSDEVRAFVVDNACMWLEEYHLDGLRLDAVHAIFDSSAVHVLEQLAAAVDVVEATSGRSAVIVAESDLNDPRILASPAVGGYGIDASWSDDLHHSIHALLHGERAGYYADFGTLDHLAKALTQGYVYDGQYSRFRQRRHGRNPAGIEAHRLVCYSQTHDQVGNRALGERLVHLVGPARARIAAALAVLAPTVTMLFQGEEWAASTPFLYFCDHSDPELGRAVTEGRRREFASFGWKPEEVPDPQALDTFERSVLRWEEVAEPEHAAMLDWYRRLSELRRTEPDLGDGSFSAVEASYDDDDGLLVMRRGDVTVTVNLGSRPVAVPGTLLLGSGLLGSGLLESGILPDDGSGTHLVGPDGVAVTRQQ